MGQTLDRVNISDRGAMMVATSIVKALGHNVKDVSLSRSGIRRARMVNRINAAAEERSTIAADMPLLLHWDGKLLPDFSGNKTENVDRVAILVTRNGTEKLLAKIHRGTGEAQANACLGLIDEWGLKSQIKGLVFDTTASNTGLHSGACTIIELALNTELLWLACRHHIFEVILSDVVKSSLGPTSGKLNKWFTYFSIIGINVVLSLLSTSIKTAFLVFP